MIICDQMQSYEGVGGRRINPWVPAALAALASGVWTDLLLYLIHLNFSPPKPDASRFVRLQLFNPTLPIYFQEIVQPWYSVLDYGGVDRYHLVLDRQRLLYRRVSLRYIRLRMVAIMSNTADKHTPA